MAITVNLRYIGRDGAAVAYVCEMVGSRTADRIRARTAICGTSTTGPCPIRRPSS